jgi:hypothetical protein
MKKKSTGHNSINDDEVEEEEEEVHLDAIICGALKDIGKIHLWEQTRHYPQEGEEESNDDDDDDDEPPAEEAIGKRNTVFFFFFPNNFFNKSRHIFPQSHRRNMRFISV